MISDRYDASSLAYQSVVSGRGGPETVEWIRGVNGQAMRPDLTVVLDVDPEVAATRREARGEPAQLYETSDVQRALAVFYRDLERHMRGDRVVVIRAHDGPDEVHAQVLAACNRVLGTPKP